MKKIKLTIAGLMIAGFSYSQAQDTICHSFAGKIHFEFDYYENKIIDRDTSVFFENRGITINKNEFLVVDLYDDCTCVENNNFIKRRKIIVYFRNGNIKTYLNSSKNDTFHFDGLKIKKIIIGKPELKKSKTKSMRS